MTGNMARSTGENRGGPAMADEQPGDVAVGMEHSDQGDVDQEEGQQVARRVVVNKKGRSP